MRTPPPVRCSARARRRAQLGCPPGSMALPRYDKAAAGLLAVALVYALPGRNSGIRSVYLGRNGCPLAWPRSGDAGALGLHAVALAPARAIQSGEQPTGTMPSRPQVGPHRLEQPPWPFALSPPDAALGAAIAARCAVQAAAFRCAVVVLAVLGRTAPAMVAGMAGAGAGRAQQGQSPLVLAGLTLRGFAGDRGPGGLFGGRLRAPAGTGPQPCWCPCRYGPPCSVERASPFWDSFLRLITHLQRFSSVVNDHLQPWLVISCR